MNIKKITMLASMALALGAFAIPASASAAEWTDEGATLEAAANVTFSGTAQFDTGTAGVHCPTVVAKATLQPGSTGTINSFEGVGCKGIKGLNGASATTTATGLPWVIHANDNGTITITDVHIDNALTPSPPFPPSATIFGDVTATPNNPEEISSVALSGKVETTAGEADVSGSLNASPAGRYGIK